MMKTYCAIWYNRKLALPSAVKIIADNIIEAEEAMILYMNNYGDSFDGLSYTIDDIESIVEEDDVYIHRNIEMEAYKHKHNLKTIPKEIIEWEGKYDEVE